MKNFPIVILAGFSGTGKSTLGAGFCKTYGYNFIKHQELVHSLAISKGFKRARYWLAEVGIGAFISESIEEMILKVKSQDIQKGVLIDVGYGTSMIERFRSEFPESKIIVVSVLADAKTREDRILGRMGTERDAAKQEMNFRDEFLEKAGVEEVMADADIVIPSEGKPLESVKKLHDEIEEHTLR